jgi:hypothetical protein
VPDARHYLVQILLPVYDNDGQPQGEEAFGVTRTELTQRFGGLTAHLRAPARGLWKKEEGGIQRDDIVIFEVMSESLDADWWRQYRKTLEARFRQDVIVVRATDVTLL